MELFWNIYIILFVVENSTWYFLLLKAMSSSKWATWDNINAGVPQSSILGRLSLIYLNDLSNRMPSNCKVFAVDTSVFLVLNNI